MGMREDKERNSLLEQQIDLLKRIERYLRPKNIATVIELKKERVKTNGQIEEMTDMILQLSENAQLTVTGVKDASGNPASLDGELVWDISGDTGIGELQVAADKQSALFVRNGGVGKVVVQVKGDADLSAGVKDLIAQVELDCVGGEAVVIELNASAVPQ